MGSGFCSTLAQKSSAACGECLCVFAGCRSPGTWPLSHKRRENCRNGTRLLRLLTWHSAKSSAGHGGLTNPILVRAQIVFAILEYDNASVASRMSHREHLNEVDDAIDSAG
jgi:hypothetical protein